MATLRSRTMRILRVGTLALLALYLLGFAICRSRCAYSTTPWGRGAVTVYAPAGFIREPPSSLESISANFTPLGRLYSPLTRYFARCYVVYEEPITGSPPPICGARLSVIATRPFLVKVGDHSDEYCTVIIASPDGRVVYWDARPRNAHLWMDAACWEFPASDATDADAIIVHEMPGGAVWARAKLDRGSDRLEWSFPGTGTRQ